MILNSEFLSWAKNNEPQNCHALLCDPPYELGFMGKDWDRSGVAFNPETWESAKKHLLPGAFGMAFASARGWHRMACAIEDAGFVIHPTIFGWLYGSGFPKATRIDTQVDEKEGVEVEHGKAFNLKGGSNADGRAEEFAKNGRTKIKHEAKTELAKAFQGHRYGLQALKPALEPIIVFQKPYEGKPVDCITKTGAGALDIEGGRIGCVKPFNAPAGNSGLESVPIIKTNKDYQGQEVFGRWPSNFVCSDETAWRLDKMSGDLGISRNSGGISKKDTAGYSGGFGERVLSGTSFGDSGGCSRFFFQVQTALDEADPVYYCAKASRSERDGGLSKNDHPCVKPISLTEYLAKLLLPPKEYVPRRILVPFAGSGSEMVGCQRAGWEEIIGVEMSEEYCRIAEMRLDHWRTLQPALI